VLNFHKKKTQNEIYVTFRSAEKVSPPDERNLNNSTVTAGEKKVGRIFQPRKKSRNLFSVESSTKVSYMGG
jgi:hypothetical protein